MIAQSYRVVEEDDTGLSLAWSDGLMGRITIRDASGAAQVAVAGSSADRQPLLAAALPVLNALLVGNARTAHWTRTEEGFAADRELTWKGQPVDVRLWEVPGRGSRG